MEVKSSMHKRSISDPYKRRADEFKLGSNFKASNHHKLDKRQLKSFEASMDRQPCSNDVHDSLKQEIKKLENQLQDQFMVRCELEKALSYKPISHEKLLTELQPAKDLIKEIAILELEVVHLEKYLLSMYRKTFDQRVSAFSKINETSKSTLALPKEILSHRGHDIKAKEENLPVKHSCYNLSSEDSVDDPANECTNISRAQTLIDSSIYRNPSSLSQRLDYLIRTSPPRSAIDEAVNSYHSLPLSMLERAHDGASSGISLGDHLGSSFSKHFPDTPNWLSEEMIKCISAIYCELADPPLINHGFPSSPIPFSSSMSESSPPGQNYLWSQTSSSFRKWMESPFHIEGSKEFSGPYSTVVELQWICRDSQRLRDVEHMLQKFRSLVSRLEEVDPRKMKHEEKIAFWINVHNALVMHALLVYGIPHNNLKRISLLLKAAYNIGGLIINVDMIQSSILGCRLPRPGQWLQSLFFPKTKFKVGDARKAYAIKQPEPLLHFALCLGSHSDPAIRVYTPKRVIQELEAAKEDYICTFFKVHKEHKIFLPKILESFTKELGLCPSGLVEMIQHFMPNSLRKSFQQQQKGKFLKRIEWVPHNFNFRYLICKELTK